MAPLCFFLVPYPPPPWRCQQCPCLLFRGWLPVQWLKWLRQQQQSERRRRPGDVPVGWATGKDDQCFPRQQCSPGSSLHAVGCEKHPQPEGHWKCSLQLLNTSWSVELCLFVGFSCKMSVCGSRWLSQNLCVSLPAMIFLFFCLFPASSTGLIYIDPTNLRRSSAISSSAAAAAAALEASNSSSYLTSASSLARAYSIVIRQISDLMSLIPKYNHLVYSQYPAAVKLTYHDAVNLQVRYTAVMWWSK